MEEGKEWILHSSFSFPKAFYMEVNAFLVFLSHWIVLILYPSKPERTKARPLAAGDLTYFQALSFLGLQLSLGLGVLVNLNWYR